MAAVPWLAGCAGPQSVLDPAGAAAREIAALWWAMLIVAGVVLAGVTVLWVHALVRRPREVGADAAERISRRWVVGGGLVLPSVAIAALLGFGIPAGYRLLPLASGGEPPLRVEVVARQWRWEVRYPASGASSIDELHLPAGSAVDVYVTSEDVIHAFWVPRLGGKIDAVPGRWNVLRLHADAPGEHRGQCAEFCGIGHAYMVLKVHVHAAEDFAAWLRDAAAEPRR